MIDSRTPIPSSPRFRRGLTTLASVLLLAAGMAVAQPRAGARVDAPRVQAPGARTMRMNDVQAGAPAARSMAAPQRRGGRGYGPMTHGFAPRAGTPGGLTGLRGLPLGTEDDLAFGFGRGGRAALPCFACLERDQTVKVDVYEQPGDNDPAATLTFTQGVDSAIGFAEAVRDAASGAARVEATLPATERTLDLTACAGRPFGAGAAPRGWRW